QTAATTTKGGSAKARTPAGPSPVAMAKRTLAHWPMLAAVMLVGGLGTAQVVRMRKPAFKSETVIFYREGIQRSLINNDPGGPDPLRMLGAKLKEMLLAQANLKQVIRLYHLYPEIVARQDENAAVEMFRRKIDFKARSTDTFAITFEGTSRDEAQMVTAKLADLIVEENAKLKTDQAKETTHFLDAEKKRSNDELEKAESEVAQFVADHPEFANDNANGSRVGIGVRAQQQEQHQEAASRTVARRRASPSASAAAVQAVDPALAAQRVQAQTDVAAAQRDVADKERRLTDEHPDMRAARMRAASAEAALQAIDEKIAAEVPPAPPAAAEPPPRPRAPRAEASAKEKAPSSKKDEEIVAMETEWARLNRELTKAQQRAVDLEGRLFKAEMAASSEIGGYAAQIAVLDPAYRPTGPSSIPNKTVLGAGFFFSLAIGIVLAALRGLLFDDRIYDPSEVELLNVGPVLGLVPRASKKRTPGV
ncbi:MAG TPA: protein kinase, partial [Byssovorax sp.]